MTSDPSLLKDFAAMTSMDPTDSLDIPLEIFGQTDVLSIMTPFVYIYPASNPDITQLTNVIEAGLTRFTTSFPWVAGRITNTGRTSTSSGVFKITSHKSRPHLTIKDWRQDGRVPSFGQLAQADAPCSILKEEFFAPVHVNTTAGWENEDRSPVLQFQLSIIVDGVVLAIMANHQALDGTAQDQLAYLLDKACNNMAYTQEEIRIGNLRRETMVEPFDSDWQPPIQKPQTLDPASSKRETPNVVEHRWTHILFGPSALSALKSEVSRGLETGFVSTDDALTALVWQSLARARTERLPHSAFTTIARAVNPRRYLNIPATYPGYINNSAFSTDTLGGLTRRPLSAIAQELRANIDPASSNFGELTRSIATMMYRAEDKNSVNMFGSLDGGRDLILSSWTSMRGYDFDFGLGLGKPTYFRRMDHQRIPSLAFFLPKKPDGETVLSICLHTDDIACLQRDAAFTKFGRFIL
jgi:hypothetical protein